MQKNIVNKALVAKYRALYAPKKKHRSIAIATLTIAFLLASALLYNTSPGSVEPEHAHAQEIPKPQPAPVQIPKPTVRDRIVDVINNRQFERGEDLLRIIEECENRDMDPLAYHVNEHPQSDGRILYTTDRGIAMLNDYWQRNISDECAYDVECAINTAIDIYHAWGSFDAWACSDILNIH